MVIQRLQTLLLVIAIALAVAFLFIPFGYEYAADMATGQEASRSLCAIDFTGLIVPVAIAILLMVIGIFTFKTPGPQKLCVILSALSTAAAVGVVIYVLSAGAVDSDPSVTIRTVWGGGGLLLVAMLLAQIFAYRGIVSDQKLLRSYDRFHS
ncbi:MAG: DUF4293 domain-containing protein [Muribaculaceae bacterium]|nr:DUF4293 domain-containing protein [Muribaculaceae bacterium]